MVLLNGCRCSTRRPSRPPSEITAGQGRPSTGASSLSSFYKFLAGAVRAGLPITFPNPAHAQLISRNPPIPPKRRGRFRCPARQTLSMPAGESVIALRDRAILKFYIYSGARIATGCRLKGFRLPSGRRRSHAALSSSGGRSRVGLGRGFHCGNWCRTRSRKIACPGRQDKPWMKSFGKLRSRRSETAKINRIIEEEFGRINPGRSDRSLSACRSTGRTATSFGIPSSSLTAINVSRLITRTTT